MGSQLFMLGIDDRVLQVPVRQVSAYKTPAGGVDTQRFISTHTARLDAYRQGDPKPVEGLSVF